jgi:putative SOS response-associated peptidase YedK
MCGRVFIRSDFDSLMRAFSFADRQDAVRLSNQIPNYNGAPTRWYPVIVKDEDKSGQVGPVFISARWGLVPRWFKPGDLLPPINARSEGIATSGMFKSAYRSHRCLVPIDGFFEWRDIYNTGKNKQPYAIAMKSGEPFALAGIWESWSDPETNQEVKTFSIITCEPNDMMAQIHNRMPVILHRKDYGRWLSEEPDPRYLLVPYPSAEMAMWPIGRDVNKPVNNRPDILDEAKPDPDPQPTFF